MPVPMSKVFFNNSGSEANDTAVKLVWYYNNAHRPPAQEEDHCPHEGLSRLDHRVRQPRRAAVHAHGFRPADRRHPPHRLPALLSRRQAGRERGGFRHPHGREPRCADRARGPRHGGGLHRRAGAGLRRRRGAAAQLFRQGAGGAAQARRADDRRRGDLRLRPHRQHVRLRDIRHRAGHHDGGEVAVIGLSADLRHDHQREAVSGSGVE